MIPRIVPPDLISDGYRLVLEEEGQVWHVTIGTGATLEEAILSGVRQLNLALGALHLALGTIARPSSGEIGPGVGELCRRLALHLAGEMSREAVAEALAAVQRERMDRGEAPRA